MARLIGLGAGGHARVLIETLLAVGHEIVGVIDRTKQGRVAGVPVLGSDEQLEEFRDGIDAAFLAVGMMGDATLRRRLVEIARRAGLPIAGARHPAAIVAGSAIVHATAQIMAGAIVQSSARIDEHALINTGAIIEHDNVIGPFAHVASGARLGGNVEVGPGALVGLGATVRQGIKIGARAIVGAGAVVIDDVDDDSVVAGVPARSLERAAS